MSGRLWKSCHAERRRHHLLPSTGERCRLPPLPPPAAAAAAAMVVERVGSDPSDLHRLGNKRRVVGVVVVLPPVGVPRKTTTALFLRPLLLLLVAAGGSSSSSRQGMGPRLRRACIVLRGALIWSLPVATVVVEEGREEEGEAARVNGRTNKSFVCLGCLGIRMGCSLALLLLRWALLRLGGRGRVARWRTLRWGKL